MTWLYPEVRLAFAGGAVVGIVIAAGYLFKALHSSTDGGRVEQWLPILKAACLATWALLLIGVARGWPWLTEQPERIYYTMAPGFACVALVLIGGTLAQKRRKRAHSRYDTPPADISAQPNKLETASSHDSPLALVRVIVSFYAHSEPVVIPSQFNIDESLSRLLALNGHSDVHVRKTGSGKLIVVCARHTHGNVLPLFEGVLRELGGSVVMLGRIGVDRGSRVAIGVLCFLMFVFFPVVWLIQGEFAALAEMSIGWLIMAALLTGGWLYMKKDPDTIIRHLQHALSDEQLV